MCGIFGVYGTPDAAKLTAVGLLNLQHRGPEAAGIVSFDNECIYGKHGGGPVNDVLTPEALEPLRGHAAVGHVLYPTSRSEETDRQPLSNRAQPYANSFKFGELAIAHNGNLTNARTLYERLLQQGETFRVRGGVDTEVALKIIGKAKGKTLLKKLRMALPQLEGAYAFILLTKNQMIGVCDPLAIRPLMLGKLNGAHILSSETCALDAVGASWVRDVEPGEMVVITDENIESHRFIDVAHVHARPCIFEYVYFSLPNSVYRGSSVYYARKALGRELALEAPVMDADMVVPMPDSGNPMALGYAQELRLPFEFGITRLHMPGIGLGRSFIQSEQSERERAVFLKSSPNPAVIKDKSMVLVDDSLVRGTTMKRTVGRLFCFGAREVHVRIASPPWRFGCYYGIDEKEPECRVAQPKEDVAAICKRVQELTGATSIAYLSLDGMYRAIYGEVRDGTCPQACDACFTGDFPTLLTDERAKEKAH